MKKILSCIFLLSFLSACGPRSFSEPFTPTLTAETLQSSLELGRDFMLNHQNESGDFDYEYDYATQTYATAVSQVREAGALWGLALINHAQPSNELATATEKSLAFFKANSQVNEQGRYIVYPGEDKGDTGTVALVTLSLVDYLESSNAKTKESYEADLKEYFSFLLSLRQEDGTFHRGYDFEMGSPDGSSSPYYDGETLLALIRTAKYFNDDSLRETIEESAEAMHQKYVTEALKEDPDSDLTKGFYQWGSMAFFELYTSDWQDEKYADWTLEMAEWMIDVHDILGRSKNTGYAFEGLIVAYELARLTGNHRMEDKLLYVIDTGLFKLNHWQVIAAHTSDPMAIGGIRNSVNGTALRIDTTQHQMHALLLALEYVYSR